MPCYSNLPLEEDTRAGRFEGLSDLAWQLFLDLVPPESGLWGRGMAYVPFRAVVNSLLYVLITGYRWCDVPYGPQGVFESLAHWWLQRWQAEM